MKVISLDRKIIHECISNYYDRSPYCAVNIHDHLVDVLKLNYIPLSEYRKNKLNKLLKQI